MLTAMAILRTLPYLLSAVLLAGGGYLAGAVTDPFAPTTTEIRGELASEAPHLRDELKAARGKAAELTGELERAQTTIDRLRGELATTRTRVADLQQRTEAAEAARADAEARTAELAERVAALEARAGEARAGGPQTQAAATSADPATPAETGETTADAPEAAGSNGVETATAGQAASPESRGADATAGGQGAQPQADGAPDNPETGDSTPGDEQTAEAAGEAAQADGRNSAPDAATGADAGRALAPGTAALEPIDPTIRQANRLEGGVESYQQGDYAAAFEAWLPLAQAGYARAQLHLGALFLEGRGVQRDDALAYAWLTIAQDNGSRNARGLLNTLQQRMDAAELTRARRLVAQAGGETAAQAN
jgi:TPR repeat protein